MVFWYKSDLYHNGRLVRLYYTEKGKVSYLIVLTGIFAVRFDSVHRTDARVQKRSVQKLCNRLLSIHVGERTNNSPVEKTLLKR